MPTNTEARQPALPNHHNHRATPASYPPKPRQESYVRFRAQATGFSGLMRQTVATALARVANPEQEATLTFLEELGDEQLTLTVNLLCLEHAVDGIPYDPSARAAAQTLHERIQDLAELRNALNAIFIDSSDPRMASMIVGDAALGDYLRGLYAWSRAAIRAIEEVAGGLRSLEADWSALRSRLDDARAFYLDHLELTIHRDLSNMREHAPELADPRDPLSDIDDHLEELFWAASRLAHGLDKRFG